MSTTLHALHYLVLLGTSGAVLVKLASSALTPEGRERRRVLHADLRRREATGHDA